MSVSDKNFTPFSVKVVSSTTHVRSLVVAVNPSFCLSVTITISLVKVNFSPSRLTSILNYMDEINMTIDTDTVVMNDERVNSIMRPDIVKPSMNRDDLLKNAPEHTHETVIVPRTVD